MRCRKWNTSLFSTCQKCKLCKHVSALTMLDNDAFHFLQRIRELCKGILCICAFRWQV